MSNKKLQQYEVNVFMNYVKVVMQFRAEDRAFLFSLNFSPHSANTQTPPTKLGHLVT